MTSRATAEPIEGAVILPKRAPLWAVLGVAVTLGSQIAIASGYVAKIEGRLDGFTESDNRITKRSDERYSAIVDRLASLEKDRNDTSGRLIRLEEQLRMSVDLLREIRESMRAPPRR
ncbi:hypothetical protein [Methylobacterium indicum]|uniref:Uncharacterized protein n=1 Tax=Methylobacterium indicum TaxID=1775910 RepID=A0ABR5GW55_9HYPH|nr:hypothetical protein [Methylobacterium indicum]KMO12053.1 hypothetical protein QR78_27815 [Methylobacterium indicum]KMO14109.1 hypothetical protein QR79_26300 [Methylobacterium indicum]